MYVCHFSFIEPSPGTFSEKHHPIRATAEELTRLTPNLKIRVNNNIKCDKR